MKIVYLVNDAGVYGANLSLINMIKGLGISRDVFVILPSGGPFVALLESLSIPYKIIPFRYNSYIYKNNVLSVFLYVFRLIYNCVLNKYAYYIILDFIKKNNIGLIHTNNTRVSVGFKVAKKMNIPHIWHLRDLLDLHFSMRPFVGFEKLCKDYNESTFVICVSNIVKLHFSIKDSSSIVIYDAVESVKNISFERADKDNYFIYCGILSKSKGVFDALYAFSKIAKNRDVKLYLAGTGTPSITKKIKHIIVNEKLTNRVVLLGYRNDVKSLMKRSRALLMCSENEAYGRVTAEAMLNDCIVIGRNSGGTAELIEHEKTGFLYNTNEELIFLMEKVLNMDTTDIQNRAKKKAINSFTEEVYAEQLKQVYDSLR